MVRVSHSPVSGAHPHARRERAIATRHLTGEAMGILMGGHQLTEDKAFDVLRHYSQENNVKLREVACLVCEWGSLS
ncbi:ANTAR domain-containing protein [Streptomyces sp. Marseille-Q5077]|uniref:ANTAR domain-containing protein n=1 Tax=Streptomyces sp. Marseille-Q5077 TaxID=3418995 RepID=UPI003CFFAC69